MKNLEKGLYIISTPIGNLEDISFRAKTVLSIVDFIICENPIHSLKLLNKLGIKKKLFSLHDYNENILIKRIEKHQKNSSIALISDSGSPLISDPGYKLVQDYINKNLFITSVPGPSSIIPALQLSGIPINNFIFFGFVPKNKNLMISLIKKISNLQFTTVHFLSGSKIMIFLKLLLDNKINRTIAVCKEITKINEKVYRGNIEGVLSKINLSKNNLKGEFIVILEGNKQVFNLKINSKIENEIKKLMKKFSLTETVQIVHKLTKISKKEIYNKALLLQND